MNLNGFTKEDLLFIHSTLSRVHYLVYGEDRQVKPTHIYLPKIRHENAVMELVNDLRKPLQLMVEWKSKKISPRCFSGDYDTVCGDIGVVCPYTGAKCPYEVKKGEK